MRLGQIDRGGLGLRTYRWVFNCRLWVFWVRPGRWAPLSVGYPRASKRLSNVTAAGERSRPEACREADLCAYLGQQRRLCCPASRAGRGGLGLGLGWTGLG